MIAIIFNLNLEIFKVMCSENKRQPWKEYRTIEGTRYIVVLEIPMSILLLVKRVFY